MCWASMPQYVLPLLLLHPPSPPGDQDCKLARKWIHFMAQACEEYPGRLGSFASLPTLSDTAGKEIRVALSRYNAN